MPRARCRQVSDLLLACAGLLCLVLALASSGARADAIEDVARVGELSVEQQAQWLSRSAESGALAKLDDAQLVALFRSLDARTLPRYLQDGLDDFQSCEFTMRRRERIKGKWPKRSDHMLVRVTREPLRIYAKWLPDGAHAGQEVIYDDSKRPDQLYGHLGGLLGVVPMWTSVNGAFARAQSNHSIRELGIVAITQRFIEEGRRFAEAGITKPSDIEVKMIDGLRVVALTYETPTGQPEFYAKKEVLGLDLERPVFRTLESYDNEGNIFESVVFERIEIKPFDDLTFDPKNPDYRF
ncbi:membrane protein [Caballeronia jiangsuensis]|nr:membrane protein [Caballeronia jiangsuensis]